jgi:hypothetical protein
MSIIMPSGNKSVQDWTSETENSVVKTASTGSAPKDFRTTLYEAAKKSVEDAAKRVKKQACDCANTAPTSPVQETDAMPSTDMGAPAGIGAVDTVAPVADEEAVDVTVDDKGEISDVSPSAALDKAKAALTDAMTAIDEAQASVGGESGEVGEEVGEVSVDIPVDEEETEETKEEKPFDFDKPEEKKEDIVVESKDKKKDDKKENPFAKKDEKKDEKKDGKVEECKENCEDDKKEKKENPFAKKETCASVDGYVKLSMVSKKNRDLVYDYYKNKLGLPEDFCKLVVTNYEK